MNAPGARWTIPHVFIFLSGLILVAAVLTYIVPSGRFERTQRTYGTLTQSVIVPGSYRPVDKHYSARGSFVGDPVSGKASPTSVLGLFTAIPKGLQQSASLVFFILLVGATFGIVNHTGSINALLFYLVDRFEKYPLGLTFVIYMVLAVGSSFMGILTEIVPLVPVALVLSERMGYDRLFGVALILLPAFIGWGTGVTNPFTVQIAQQLAELPIGSGAALRATVFVLASGIGFLFLVRHARGASGNPGPLAGSELDALAEVERPTLTARHLATLGSVLLCYAVILYSTRYLGWGITEMSGGFLAIGVVVVLINRMSGDEAMEVATGGLQYMIVPALTVGVARGISVVLQEGMVIDTILFHASNAMLALPKVMVGQTMLAFQTLLNFLIPSASGQALVSMPLMVPLADLAGISRQTAVLAFV
ncbi:MAG: hypothetical protein AAFU79_14350, partial [Myxococcota bacterium]